LPQVYGSIEIDAPPSRVWDVFTDTSSFPSWNPFIRRMIGELVVGRHITIELKFGCVPMWLHPRVTVVRPPSELRWLARQPIPGVFDVERVFEFEPYGAKGTRFVQYETGRGLLAPLLMPVLEHPIAQGYAKLNEALRARVER
jgi:hypothetical protein